MKIQKIKLFFIIFALFLLTQPGLAEKFSLRLTYNTNSINGNDINPWIESMNTLWSDYQGLIGGNLQGEFVPLNYGGSIEVEIRITLYKGLGLNFAGSRYSSSEEGTISLSRADGSQTESQFIGNSVTAWPIKIGVSYALAMPFFERLSLVAGLGRHIILTQYETTNNIDAQFYMADIEAEYRDYTDVKYNSEKLGFYFNFAAEMELVQFLAAVVEVEKVWNTVDGFKGSCSNDYYERIANEVFSENRNGSFTLYNLESDVLETGKFYNMLDGYERRPEGPDVNNIRQGELDFNNFSFKIGFRFKF